MFTSHEDLCTFMIISGSFLHIMKMFQAEVVENKTHILWSTTFFFLENLAVNEIKW